MRKIRYFLRGRLFPCALLFALIVAGFAVLAIRLPNLLAPVAMLERAFSFAVAIFIVASAELPERKIAKLILLFLPWLGAILCILFRDKTASVSRNESVNRGHDGVLSRVTSLSERFTGLPPVRTKRVQYFPVGRSFYEQFLADLHRAKSRIYLEFYIVSRGVFWGDVLAILQEKADMGLDIRLIYDDFGCSLTLPADYAQELERKGIKTAVFRRMKVARGFSKRDHRKLALIDDVAYTGGINLADEYIGERIRFGHWKDSAVRLEGGISAFSELFLRTWYALRPSDGIPKEQFSEEGNIPAALIADDASDAERLFPHLLCDLAANAGQKLYLCTPYLSLPHDALEALASAAQAGVDVRVLIPHIPDKKAVFFLSEAYARELIARGIRIREYIPGFLHAKSIVLDGQYSLVSSYNLDFRSLYVQAECGVFVSDTVLADSLESDFLATWEQSAPPKKTNAFVRTLGRIMMLFAPLT